MRRSSYTPLPTQAPGEPLIVVEESGGTDDEEGSSRGDSPQLFLNPDSPLLNPELLSPYRDMRKRSLPTPQCTSGITASQVRRLSEHGTEAASNAREAAFLATLSSGPQPAPGGRRHSVVTISRAPPTSILFGRNRRESIAAFPSQQATRILANRRDSTSSVPRPPSTAGSTSGSQFNLQLDIMDDIAEIKAARKVRLKMWKTPSREMLYELQPIEGASGAATRYSQMSPGPSSRPDSAATTPISRRYSEFVPSVQPTQQQQQRRRASELPPSAALQKPSTSSGIVCSNTDLISILSSLASSAQEINKVPDEEPVSAKQKDTPKGIQKSDSTSSSTEQRRNRLKNLRSNSFDVSMLLGTGAAKQRQDGGRSSIAGPTSWFIKRHQPKKSDPPKGQTKPLAPVMVSLSQEKTNTSIVQPVEPPSSGSKKSVETPTSGSKRTSSDTSTPPENKVVWDGKSGSVVDAQVLGSAIEVFLARRGSGNDNSSGSQTSSSKVSPTKNSNKNGGAGVGGTKSWFSGNKDSEDDAGASDSCDSSLCSTLKDLFVK